MLKKLKLAALGAAERLAISALVADSPWRRDRLLILCYHGVSLADEHVWNPTLYISPTLLRERLEFLRESGANVLPLGEALERLRAGNLPTRAVALTFDDGTYDFYREAFPILRDLDCPATLYLTTAYCQYNRPVFDLMCGYLLWMGREKTLTLPGVIEGIRLDDAGREQAARALKVHVRRTRSSEPEKDTLLASLAKALGIDYERLCAQRLLHLVNMNEVGELAAAGIDIQLHTHNHRVSLVEDRFRREIDDNRSHIERVSKHLTRHFCYPSGYYKPEFLPWLRASGVESATTCEPGLASPDDDLLLLPRLVDSQALSWREFSGWVSGVAALLPRRPSRISDAHLLQMMDDELDPRLFEGLPKEIGRV